MYPNLYSTLNMYQNAINLLSTYHHLSDDLQERLLSKLQTLQVKKKTKILEIGQMSNFIYYIQTGLLRTYYLKDGVEICSAILGEKKMAVSVHSFFQRMPSYEFMETIEPCTLYYFSYNDLEKIYDEFIEFNIVGRKLITEYYCLSEMRSYMLRGQTAAQKISFFLDAYGDLVPRIPRKDIASFLGMTLETLGRVGYQ